MFLNVILPQKQSLYWNFETPDKNIDKVLQLELKGFWFKPH